MSGTFTGGVFSQSTFAGVNWGDPVTGSVIYNQDLLAGHTTDAYFNLSLQEPYSAFSLQIGTLPLVFNLANETSATPGLPAIQFANGNFRGFAYNSDFLQGGQLYRFAIQGGQWAIYDEVAPGLLGQRRASGYIQTPFTSLQQYTPAPDPSEVPEPATVGLIAAGLIGVCLLRRAA
ncbi:MAG TPA: PEP-CTERM sorting domain-containing protein [Bryobacteraceae bacterium]|nr:PEP-CTERM sorting domain-containing protein [Bryobacteraceae bacterium]